MSESGPQTENRTDAGGYPDRDVEREGHGPRWLAGLLTATSLLVVIVVGAYFLFGTELFQRSFSAVAVVIVWPGALVGITL
jgi:hypothetical protein